MPLGRHLATHLTCPYCDTSLKVEIKQLHDELTLHTHCEMCGLAVVVTTEDIVKAIKQAIVQRLETN
jgi:transcription elongation factor Elf1